LAGHRVCRLILLADLAALLMTSDTFDINDHCGNVRMMLFAQYS